MSFRKINGSILQNPGVLSNICQNIVKENPGNGLGLDRFLAQQKIYDTIKKYLANQYIYNIKNCILSEIGQALEEIFHMQQKIHSGLKQDYTFLPNGILNTQQFALKGVIFSSVIDWRNQNQPTIVPTDLIIMKVRGKYLQPSSFSFSFPSLFYYFDQKLYFPRAFYLFCCSFQ